MISDEKLKEIMNGIEIGIENRVRHAYNCGWNDGFNAVKGRAINEIRETIDDVVITLLEKEKEKTEKAEHDGCKGCVHFDKDICEEPCVLCKQNYTDKWKSEF